MCECGALHYVSNNGINTVCLPDGMVKIPGGLGYQGCDASIHPSGCGSTETPRVQINLSEFYIDVVEVTVVDYLACFNAGACTEPFGGSICDTARPEQANWDKVNNIPVSGRDRHPINCVDWTQANSYCTWVNKTLPTEAQWERAALGGCDIATGVCEDYFRPWPWGTAFPTCDYGVIANATDDGCGTGLTFEGGTRALGVSPYGVYYMMGNVQEWTADWFHSDYYCQGAAATGSTTCVSTDTPFAQPAVDPVGPTAGFNGVTRSTRGFHFTQDYMWSNRVISERSGLDQSIKNEQTGFRCARVY
jgi:formylglycine-generating enzyme required for sulfatase activity